MKKGFTLVELLVVVAIIGLIAGIAVVSVNSTRAKARDTKRLEDIKQIQNALAQRFSDLGMYPPTPANGSKLGSKLPGANNAQVLTSSMVGWEAAASAGTTVYLSAVPRDPQSMGEYVYTYTAVPGQELRDYSISFKLEAGSGSFEKGSYAASSAGIQRMGN